MKSLATASALTALTVSFAMCGGTTINDRGGDGGNGGDDDAISGDDGGSPDSPLWDDVLRIPACGQYLTVPAGNVYVGAWDYNATNPAFTPTTTCDATDPGNRKLSVSDFALMQLPATNLCYEECVKEGACAAPTHDIADPNPLPWTDATRANEPVYVDHDTAQAFCVWLGGSLPTLAQLLRATQGDAVEPGVAAMTAAAIQCQEHPDPNSQICGQLASMDLTNPHNALYPVGQVAMDVGPFGHQDLYGEGFEWTNTFAYFTDSKFCSLASGAPDYGNFAEAPQFCALQWAALVDENLEGSTAPLQPGNADPSASGYQYTLRCAFPLGVGNH
jgi:formylglycine-generating enzyme required for sulfatase activity